MMDYKPIEKPDHKRDPAFRLLNQTCLFYEVAGDEAPIFLNQGWGFLGADIDALAAAGMEGTAGRRAQRARDFTGQDNTLALVFKTGIRYRNGGKQGPGIGMPGVLVEHVAGGELNNLAQIQNGNALTDVTDHREVV